MRSDRARRCALLLAAALSGGCMYDWDALRYSGAAADVPVDRRADAPADRPPDVPVEPDASVDAGPDVPVVTDVPVVMDVPVGMDAPVDRPVDVVMDAGVDVPVVMDVPVDRPVDTGPPDVGPPDTGPPDTGPPACTPAGPTCPCAAANPGGYCSPGAACTGGRCVAGTLAGSLVITEIMNDPSAVGDDLGEWVEVYNPGATPLDLRTVRISNSRAETHTITAAGPVVLAPMAHGVLARNGNVTTNGNVAVLYTYAVTAGVLNLGNSSRDAVILDLGSVATEIDRVAYDASTSATWPRSPGHAKSLSPTARDAAANDLPLNWCNAPAMLPSGDYGSPGAANPACP